MGRCLLYFLVIFTVGACRVNASDDAAKCRIVYFYEKNCPEKCREVDGIILPALKEIYGGRIEVTRLDLEHRKNFEALMAFESRYGVAPDEVPEFYTSFGAVRKNDNIREKLTGLIEMELSSGTPGPYAVFLSARLEADDAATSVSTGGREERNRRTGAPLDVMVFRKPGCRTCSRLDISMRYVAQKYPDMVRVSNYSIGDDRAKVLEEALCIRYNVPEKFHLATPAIFFGEKYHAGEVSLKNVDIVGEVINAMDTAGRSPTPVVSEDELLRAERAIIGRCGGMKWTAVLSAGFIDGINPCAFVTIIFLLSYLGLMRYGRRDIVLVGLSFTSAVFLTYLSIGFGFLRLADFLAENQFLADCIYFSAVFLALAVGILNLRDCLRIRRGSLRDMGMKLGDGLRKRINGMIRRNVRLKHYVLGAALTGAGVSVLELACTGQTYLPTILFIVNTQGLRSQASMMLVAYNIAFILPLLAVFALYLHGVTDERLSAWLGRRGAAIKLATGLIFIALAFLLVYLKV